VTVLPDRYALDTPTLDALPEIVALLNSAAAHDNDNPATADDLRRQWQLTGMADVTLAREKDSGTLVGIVGAVPMPSNQRLYMLFNVHPDHRATSLPGFLLKRIEAYVQALPHPPTAEHTILVHPINGANLWKREILPWYGYSVERGMWKVAATFGDEPPAPPHFPDGVEISTFQPASDLAPLQQAVATFFEDDDIEEQQEWLRSVTRDGDYAPELWYLARHQGGIIGFVIGYPDPDAGVIALVGVAQDWRNLGIGENLLRQSFVGFYERGTRYVMMHIDSEHPRPQALRVYRKAGMEEIDALLIYEKRIRIPQPEGNGHSDG
jgi:ribosomal protein S18 acetylase RimI-like enzyme